MPRARRRLTVVYNPMKVEDLDADRKVVADACRRQGWDEPAWIETTPEETGEKQGREAVEAGADVVATLGGDGTVRAVATALVGTDVALGLLPGGTGNLLARNLDLPVEEWAKEEGIAEDDILQRVTEAADKYAAERAERFGPEIMTYVERSVILQTIDHLWREHIVNLDHLRSVVGFRGYAQRDPLQEYKAEAFELFQALLANLREAVTAQLMRVELVQQEPQQPELPEMTAHHLDPLTGEDEMAQNAQAAFVPAGDRDPENPATWGRIGRNEMCPCGSGKKYKHCHGVYEQA